MSVYLRRSRLPLLAIVLFACGRTPLEGPAPAEPSSDAGAPRDVAPGRDGQAGSGAGGTGGSAGAGGTGGGASGSGGTGAGGTGGGGTGGLTPDAGRDVIPPPPDVFMPPPVASCPAVPPAVRPRLPTRLAGFASPPDASSTWTLMLAPSSSSLHRRPLPGPAIDFTPDVTGTYQLRFEVRDALGRTASCVVTLEVRPQPPVVSCPPEATTTVDSDLALAGAATDDDGPVQVSWTVDSAPGPVRLTPFNAAATIFRAGRPGLYALTMTATDRDGSSASCTARVRVIAPLMVSCPPSGESHVRLRDVTLSARVDRRPASVEWRILRRPPGSLAEPRPADRLTTSVVPDVAGDYAVELVARAFEGGEARCQTSFRAVTFVPVLSCGDVDTRPLAETTVAAGLDDNGNIVSWQWSLLAAPPGSAVKPMFPDGDSFTFRPDLAGDYVFALTVIDDESHQASCKLAVHANASEGLRVEMFWDSSGTDMDLHLLSPQATRWFDESTHEDCFYSNCTDQPPNWSNPMTNADDPHLDLDDTDGLGPENINVDQPAPGIFRVGVHAFSGSTERVTVRIYCGGPRLEPRATLGPIALREEQLWRVADVEILPGGGCSVSKLSLPDGSPDLIPRSVAETTR
jgi:hypothetical protein